MSCGDAFLKTAVRKSPQPTPPAFSPLYPTPDPNPSDRAATAPIFVYQQDEENSDEEPGREELDLF